MLYARTAELHTCIYMHIHARTRFLHVSLKLACVRHVRICLHAVSVSEVLPRERKTKEEKTVTIGMASVDLIPLLLGEIVFHLKCMHAGRCA